MLLNETTWRLAKAGTRISQASCGVVLGAAALACDLISEAHVDLSAPRVSRTTPRPLTPRWAWRRASLPVRASTPDLGTVQLA